MHDKPLVSVIVTCYNKEPWIRQSAESVLSQNVSDLELILVDDASTDCSGDVIRAIESSHPDRVHTVFHKQNQGIAKTWKEAVNLARGEYVARCDGDDYWASPQKLEKQLALMGRDCLWCNTDFNMVDGTGSVLHECCFDRGVIPLADTFEKMLATRGFTNASTWLIQGNFARKAAEALSSDAVDDTFELQLWMLLRTNLVTVHESLVNYRVAGPSDSHPDNVKSAISRSSGLMNTQIAYLYQDDKELPVSEEYPKRAIDFKQIARLLVESWERRNEDFIVYDNELHSERQHVAQLEETIARVNGQLEKTEGRLNDVQLQLNGSRVEASALIKELDTVRAELDAVYKSKRWQLISRIASLVGK